MGLRSELREALETVGELRAQLAAERAGRSRLPAQADDAAAPGVVGGREPERVSGSATAAGDAGVITLATEIPPLPVLTSPDRQPARVRLATSTTPSSPPAFGTPPRVQVRSRSNVERRQQSLSVDRFIARAGRDGDVEAREARVAPSWHDDGVRGGGGGGGSPYASSGGSGSSPCSAGPPPKGPTHRRRRTEPEPSFDHFNFADDAEGESKPALTSPSGYTKL